MRLRCVQATTQNGKQNEIEAIRKWLHFQTISHVYHPKLLKICTTHDSNEKVVIKRLLIVNVSIVLSILNLGMILPW